MILNELHFSNLNDIFKLKKQHMTVIPPFPIFFHVPTPGSADSCKIRKERMSQCIRKPTICICQTKGADQLYSNCTTDQRLCFRYSDSKIHLFLKSKISSFWPDSETVHVGLCQTWSETKKMLVFSCEGSLILIQTSDGNEKTI